MSIRNIIQSILSRVTGEKPDAKKENEQHDKTPVIDTGGAAYFGGNVTAGGDIIWGDKNVHSGKELRDEHYEIALNWNGEQPMREFDLSERDLSGLSLANADLRKANLKDVNLSQANLVNANLSQADLSDTNLKEADLSEADLNGAKYTASTIWPDRFEPEKAGAILID